jgi:secreted PhoX family phosphatase
MYLKPNKLAVYSLIISIFLITVLTIIASLDLKMNTSEAFVTSTKPYLQPLPSSNASIKAILTTNDTLSDGYIFQKTPDGMGAFVNKNGTIDVFVNHELDHEEDGEFAKISKLTLDTNGSVLGGKLIENGTGKYNVFCSAYLIEGHGFTRPVFITNEEVDDGIVIAYDALNGNKTEMPWLGNFSHENTILLPGYNDKTVLLGTEDGEYDHSQLYMYVANSPSDLMHGRGILYVLVGDNNITNFRDLKKGQIYNAHFEPLTWNWKTQGSSDLENETQLKNGLDFIRLEDLHYDQNNNSIIYVADTGDKEAGENYKNGRIYSFELSTSSLNTPKSTTTPHYDSNITVMLDGDAGDKIRNPDNVATSKNSLMIQEDLNDYNRIMDGENAKILRFDLRTHELEPVAMLDQSYDTSKPKAGEWESSGILDVSSILGEGNWLTNVQAHTINGGQILLLNVDKS